MKTAQDPRHLQRIKVMQNLFSLGFSKENVAEGETSQDILKNLSTIDELIKKSAPSWPVEKINKIDLSILRLAVYELKFDKNTPHKVVIDEAVELAKEFGSDSSASFINGALGKILKDNVQ